MGPGRGQRPTWTSWGHSIRVADPTNPPNPRGRYTYRFTAGNADTIELQFDQHDDSVLGYGMTMTETRINRLRFEELMRALPQASALVIEWGEVGNGRTSGNLVLSLDGGAPVLQRLVAMCTRPEACHPLPR
jgi:hypothetical protein